MSRFHSLIQAIPNFSSRDIIRSVLFKGADVIPGALQHLPRTERHHKANTEIMEMRKIHASQWNCQFSETSMEHLRGFALSPWQFSQLT